MCFHLFITLLYYHTKLFRYILTSFIMTHKLRRVTMVARTIGRSSLMSTPGFVTNYNYCSLLISHVRNPYISTHAHILQPATPLGPYLPATHPLPLFFKSRLPISCFHTRITTEFCYSRYSSFCLSTSYARRPFSHASLYLRK